MLWSEQPMAGLLKAFPGRTPTALLKQAWVQGLNKPYPQGMMSLAAAAHKLGVTRESLNVILKWAGVTTQLYRGSGLSNRLKTKHRNRLVNYTSAEKACESWWASESALQAAARLGVNPNTFNAAVRHAKKIGMLKLQRDGRIRSRYPPKVYDQVWATWQERCRLAAIERNRVLEAFRLKRLEEHRAALECRES